MAVVTGTLLLRPVASQGSHGTTVPADTPTEEIYKLINEEVSDGAATTFKPTYWSGSYYTDVSKLRLKYSLPKNVRIISVNNITSVVRKTENNMYICICPYSEGSMLNGTLGTYWSISGGDSNYAAVSSDKSSFNSNGGGWCEELSNAIAEALNNDDFALGYTTGASKGTTVTQAYIELDCTYEEAGTPLYFKKNGEWAELSGNVYQKANGEWLETDVSVLGGEFPVKEVI